MKPKKINGKKIISLLLTVIMLLGVMPMTNTGMTAQAASYSSDWRYWSQAASDIWGIRSYGCWVVAQAKLIYEANIDRSSSFNPDSYYWWQVNNGYIDGGFYQTNGANAPVAYANQKGKSLQYLGYWSASDDQLWYNINAGYFTIVKVNNGGHYVYIANDLSKQKGQIYCYDSWTDYTPSKPRLLNYYGVHDGGYVYKTSGSNSGSSVKEPTTVLYPTSGSIVKLASGVGSNMYLDFVCGNNNVQIYENADNSGNADWVKSQYFKLIHVKDGWYAIVNTGNSLAVDVTGASTASGTNVQQWQHTNGDAQLFRFYDAGNGYCYIKSKLGCYVDVCDGANRNNANVWVYTYNGSNAQKWQIQYHSHTANSSSITTQPTCTKTGVRTCNCYYCGITYSETIAKKSHNSNTNIPAVAASCTTAGLTSGKKCSMCGTVTVAQHTIPAKGHTDNNADGYCDSCGSDINPQAHCSCSCHKTGLPKLLFAIVNFFQKLFGNNKVCSCGAKH